MVHKNKQKLAEYALNSGDFTRNRKLPIEHTIGILLHMAAHRNINGYAISSQDYFSELSKIKGEVIKAATHQAVSRARSKVDWQALRFLLGEANQDSELSSDQYRYRGHITRAVDGTQLTLPYSEDILDTFEQRTSKAGIGHYPGALMVTALNVFTGQCKCARVVNHIESERSQLMSMIDLDFSPGDLSLLDRGFGGDQVFLCFEDYKQFYLCRMRATGDRNAQYVQDFLNSRKKEKIVRQAVVRKETGEIVEIKIRLVRGQKDNEGKRIIWATNLLDQKKYSRKSLMKLYRTRWTVETLYDRVKNLLKLESFHARNINGVMQEIYANLLVISLTALVSLAAASHLKLNPDVAVPSFKNVQAVVKRHLLEVIQLRSKPNLRQARQLAKILVEEASQIIWKKQPGRSYPRVSMQPIKIWNLAKNRKLKEYKNAQK